MAKSDRQSKTPQSRHEEFAARIIAMLEKGTAPWQKPWKAGELHPPFNPVSGTVYSGINRVMLSEPDYADPRWMTFKQAGQKKYRVKKGSKSQTIVHWQWTEAIDKTDENGRPVLDAFDEPEKIFVRLARPRVRFYSVFHAGQLETENGQPIPAFEPKELEWQPNERAEAILEASGAEIIHDQRDRGFYSIHKDEIHLPPKENFANEGDYYSTAFHELGHWTRHPSRLNRENGPFGSEMYSREELRAHIASWMLSQDLGIAFNPEQNHASYVDNWIKVLKDDPYEIIRACSDAERIKQYIMGLDQKQEQAAEITFSDPEADGDNSPSSKKAAISVMPEAAKWYHDLNRPDDFEYLYSSLAELASRDDPEKIGQLKSLYDNFVRLISESVTDELGPERILDRSRSRLASQLLETQMLHGKLIELESLPPDARFQHQELAEGILELEAGRDSSTLTDGRSPKPEPAKEIVYLNVAYKERREAKEAGAKWNAQKKLWYAPVGSNLSKLAKFLPENEPAPAPAVSPVEEFRQTLEANGFVLKGDPIMDGKIHRVPIEGKPGQRDGAYQAYADGVPNGWFENHRDGAGKVSKWLYSGQQLTPAQKTAMQAQVEQRREQLEKDREKQYAQAAGRAFDKFAACAGNPVDPEHPYLKSKGVGNYGLHQDQDGNLLVFGLNLDLCEFPGQAPPEAGPRPDLDDLTVTRRIQTVQTISPDGEKRFEPGSRKKGAVHLIGESQFKKMAYDQAFGQKSLFDDLKESPEILLAEGYSTGASLHEATGLPVAVAFDAGNLLPVAEALRRKFPQANLTLCADNDYPLVHKQIQRELGDIPVTPELEEKYAAHNKGVVKATEAAQAVKAKVLVPQFTGEERAKGLTDFNDLAGSRGTFAVTKIVHPRHRAQAVSADLRHQADNPSQGFGLAM